MFTDEKSKMKSMILKKTDVKPMEEEIINTKVEEKKKYILHQKKKRKILNQMKMI